jgi:hypothetical protein
MKFACRKLAVGVLQNRVLDGTRSYSDSVSCHLRIRSTSIGGVAAACEGDRCQSPTRTAIIVAPADVGRVWIVGREVDPAWGQGPAHRSKDSSKEESCQTSRRGALSPQGTAPGHLHPPNAAGGVYRTHGVLTEPCPRPEQGHARSSATPMPRLRAAVARRGRPRTRLTRAGEPRRDRRAAGDSRHRARLAPAAALAGGHPTDDGSSGSAST